MNNKLLTVPAVALRGMTLLPGMIAHFDISRARSIRAVETAMEGNHDIFLVTQRDVEQEEPSVSDLYEVGVYACIKQVIKLQNDIVRILVEGLERARLHAFTAQDAYLEAEISLIETVDAQTLDDKVQEAMVASIWETFSKFASVHRHLGQELLKRVREITELSLLIDYVTNNLPISYKEKQSILELDSLEGRYEALLLLLFKECDVIAIKRDFQQKVKARVDKHQKEYLLREQMSIINEELGENGPDSEAEGYRRATEELDAPDEVKERLFKEIRRFKSISGSSSESAVVRGYIETLLELPWNHHSEDNRDLDHAGKVLEDEHYGLTKVKERVLDFLAVRNLTGGANSPIICLVGPPGTGKTSIARSIAHALGKEYVRICLGGVRDEAEIRGHRKTYVGAMPGRLIAGLKSAGVNNPLMLLDEIDKVGSDHRGDTASALLEVLDSEQNRHFRDHYVELPVDLSEVFFLATANSTETIPKPLLDRMEIIELSSYTENEKLHIARRHLWKKQLAENGLTPKQLTISDGALAAVISSYTKEAGVRTLERRIGEICRKSARMIYQKNAENVRVRVSNLEDFLGKPKYRQKKRNAHSEIGVVRGLAWTSVGGVTLEVEVNTMPGKGEIRLTGQLGDVMKESAMAAITYIRSLGDTYHVKEDYFQTHDIHIHIPEGAVPKDGPSAGITMATAILSAVTGIPVHADLAMTGEITLRGRVLPIGGLKEKLLAAKNAGITKVCVPKDNEKDVEEIDSEITDGMTIHFVTGLAEVLALALEQ